MLNALRENFPRTVNPLIENLDACITEMDPITGSPPSRTLSQIITEGSSETLTDTENAQPAILFTSLIILRVLEEEFGFKTQDHIDFYLGHSLGEFTALVACGALTLRDAVRLVRRRGEVMAACARGASSDGDDSEVGMVALIVPKQKMPQLLGNLRNLLTGDPDEIFGSEERCVQLANINSSTQVVLSGHIKGIDHLLRHLRSWSGQDPRAIRLNVSAPFHSMIMAPSVRTVSDMLKECRITFPGKGEVLSNVTARPYTSAKEIEELLPRQAVETVMWKDSIRYLDEERNVQRWIGIGPGTKVGRNLIGKEIRSGFDSIITVGEDLDGKGFEELVRRLEKWP